MLPFVEKLRFCTIPRGRRGIVTSAFVLILGLGWGFSTGAITLHSWSLKIPAAPAVNLEIWAKHPGVSEQPSVVLWMPGDARVKREAEALPQGSLITAHLGEQGGSAPELYIDGRRHLFHVDKHGEWEVEEKLEKGRAVSVRRDGRMLASTWIRIIPDQPPEVAMTAPPMLLNNILTVSYKATDDFGISDVRLRVTPQDTLPGASHASVDLPLSAAGTRRIERADVQDLSGKPWTGLKVKLQVVAVNEAGREGLSEPYILTLPERRFYHPIARVLIEERSKLLRDPDDEALRQEAANIMAGIAHAPESYRGDPVVMMALRTGAVRLVLGRDRDAAVSVNDLLWEAASRIENGNAPGSASRMMKDTRRDLASSTISISWAANRPS